MRFCGKTGDCYLAHGHLGPCQPVPPRSFSDTSDPDPVHTAARAAAQRDQRRWEAALAALPEMIREQFEREREAGVCTNVTVEPEQHGSEEAKKWADALVAAFEASEPKPTTCAAKTDCGATCSFPAGHAGSHFDRSRGDRWASEPKS